MKRKRVLSDEEKRLWTTIARSTRPLRGKALLTDEGGDAGPLPLSVPSGTAESGNSGADVLVSAAARVEKASHAKIPLPGRIDRPVRRKLGKGRIEIDDRIDLHGKTEAIAHYALLNFLRDAHGNGFRHVLVITGRGASLGSSGVLRRAFPHWIATDPFRRYVSGFEVAERSHGGEGAFYVRLRRT